MVICFTILLAIYGKQREILYFDYKRGNVQRIIKTAIFAILTQLYSPQLLIFESNIEKTVEESRI